MLIISIHLLSRIPEHISPLHCLASTLWVILTKNTTSLICTASLSTKSIPRTLLPLHCYSLINLWQIRDKNNSECRIYFPLQQDMLIFVNVSHFHCFNLLFIKVQKITYCFLFLIG